jgi:hypothetical protein
VVVYLEADLAAWLEKRETVHTRTSASDVGTCSDDAPLAASSRS